MLRTINNGIRVGLLGLALVCAFPASGASKSEEYVAEARGYVAEGKPNEAVIQLKNALKLDPSNVNARLLLARVYLGMGDAPGAQKEFERASRLGAPKKDWMVGLGQALIAQNDYDGVLNKIRPDDAMPAVDHATSLAMRGNAYVAINDVEKAVEAYDQALAVQNSSPLARLGKARLLLKDNNRAEAAAQFSEVLTEYPEHAETRLARGELYRSLGKLDEALADFDVAVKVAPQNVRAYVGRALTNIQLGNTKAAKEDVQQLHRRARQLPITNYLKALLAFQEKDFGKASELLQETLRVAPENFQAQLLYGIVSYAQGNYMIADDYLSRVMQVASDNAEVRKLAGAARLKLKAPHRAIEALEPFGDDPETDDAQALALLGTAYMLAGEHEKGTQLMSRAVELDPQQALLRTQLAAGRIALGDSKGAISDLKAAVDLGQDVVQADVLLVLSYLNQKQYDAAVKTAGDLEKRMVDSPVPPNLTGLAYLAQGQFDQARAKFDQALQVDPEFVVANMNLARLALASNKPRDAQKQYEQVLKKSPKHVGAMMGLAALARAEGDEQGVQRWLVKANQANPKAMQPILVLAETYLRQNQALKATNLLSGLNEAQKKSSKALRIQGMAYLQAGEFSSAKAIFQQLAELEPNNIESWFQLGRAQAAAGDMSGAGESFDKAIALDPQHKQPLVWIGKGELALRDKNYPDALKLSKEMQEHFPNNAMSYEIEAAAHRGMGNVHAAIDAVEKAVRVEGNSKRINLFAHILASSGKTPKAVTMLGEWLDKNPNDGVSWTTMGMMQQQIGRVDEAITAYEKAIKLGGDNPVVLNNMAWLYLDRDDKRATELAKQAYEIAPERAEIVDTYGWVLFKQGKHKDALNVLQQALVLAPHNGEIGLHVAEALHTLGRNDEAKPLVERILEENPNTAFAAPARKLLKKLN